MDGSHQQGNVVRSETDHKDGDNRNGQILHFRFLLWAQAIADFNALKDFVIHENEDRERDDEAEYKPEDVEDGQVVVERAFKAGGDVLRLDVTVKKHRAINHCNYDKEGQRNPHGDPLVPQTSAPQRVDHRHIAIDGNAAQKKNTDIDIAEKDVSGHLA